VNMWMRGYLVIGINKRTFGIGLSSCVYYRINLSLPIVPQNFTQTSTLESLLLLLIFGIFKPEKVYIMASIAEQGPYLLQATSRFTQ
jgi:hypothetical protein